MNNKGFTLISSLLAISITSVTILLILSLSNFILKSNTFDQVHQRSVYIFLNQIGREIHGGVNFVCDADTLAFSNDNSEIFYHKEGNNLIREVNLTGYDISLRNVKSIQFKCSDLNKVNIEVNPGWSHAITWSEASEVGGTNAP